MADEVSNTPRLLLVEDDAVLQKITLRLLRQLGHAVDLAPDGEAAVQMAAAQNYAVIFMDLNLPKISGLEAARLIAQSASPGAGGKARPVVIAMTAEQLGGDMSRFQAAGIADCIAKPVQLQILREKIAQWTAPGSSASSGFSESARAGRPLDETGRSVADGRAEPPADLKRLALMSGPDHESMAALIRHFLVETKPRLERLKEALAAGDAAEVRRLAHTCAGSSSTCGMTALIGPLRRLEETAERGELIPAPKLLAESFEAFERVQDFLSKYATL